MNKREKFSIVFFVLLLFGISFFYFNEDNFVTGAVIGKEKTEESPDDSWVKGLLSSKRIDEAFLDRTKIIAKKLNVDYVSLLKIMDFESTGTFSPSIKNQASGATGLIQFMPSTAKDFGTSVEELSKMTALKQLDYVEDYFVRTCGSKCKTQADLYMAVLWSRGIGESMDYVLFTESDIRYKQKKELDFNPKDGKITKKEAFEKAFGKGSNDVFSEKEKEKKDNDVKETKSETKADFVYSIKPSFKTNINYDLEDYDLVVEGFKNILKCVNNGLSIEECVKITNGSMKDFTWDWGVHKGSEKIFYDFVSFFENCLNSVDNECTCNLFLDYSKEDIKKYELEVAYKVGIDSRQYGFLIISLGKLSKKIELKGNIKFWNPANIAINYEKDGIEEIELFFEDELSGKKTTLNPEENIYLYKYDYSGIKNMNFIELDGNEVTFPNGEEKEVKGLKECIVKDNVRKFHVTNINPDRQFYVYDEKTKTVMLKSPVIRFAAEIEELAPKKITTLFGFDRPKDTKSLNLMWDANAIHRADKYIVLLSSPDLDSFRKERTTKEILSDSNLIKYEFYLKDLKDEYDYLSPNNCEFIYDYKKCEYKTYTGKGVFLDKDTLYKFNDEFEGYFFASFDVPLNKEYEAGVIAVDKNGNMIDNSKQKLKTIKIESKDDLPIDSKDIFSGGVIEEGGVHFLSFELKSTLLNIDGSVSDDFSEYRVYYLVFDKPDDFETKKSSYVESIKSNVINKKLSLYDSFLFDPNFKRKLRLEDYINKKENQYVLLVPVVVDNSKNPSPEQFTFKELNSEFILFE